MPLRHVRVRCENVADHNVPLHFDLVINGKGELPDSPLAYCGWWGDMRGADMNPFLAHVVAGRWRLDLGTINPDLDYAERFLECDIFAHPIREGEVFSLHAWGVEHQFRIAAVVELTMRE